MAGEETDFPILLPPSGDAGAQGAEGGAGGGGGADGDREENAEAGGAGGAATAAEKVAVLDRQLEESYGKFEGMILRERGYVRDRENARGADVESAGSDDGQGGGAGGVGGGSPGGDGLPSEPATASGSGNRPAGGDQREGDYQPTAATTYKPPPDIPDGSDDDVVARQLREAAMKESDPELREKLWDEYRKYKNKSGGS